MSDGATAKGGNCPVCGEEYSATWKFEAGERPNGEHFPPGVAYTHEPATYVSAKDVEESGEEAYDGEACYAFEDGTTEENQYPRQPIVPSGDS